MKLSLNGTWEMYVYGEEERLRAFVPGSVAAVLLEHKKMPEPYWRDNEKRIQEFFDKDYVFERSFVVSEDFLTHEQVVLHCDGLDTLARIRINGNDIGRACNMHRCWRFDVKEWLHAGENTISVWFASAPAWLKDHPSRIGKPYTTLRKAACMFGWDWGLCLPDAGIWRDIALEAYDCGRIETVVIRQEHDGETVRLHVKPVCEGEKELEQCVSVFDPDGNLLKRVHGRQGSELSVEIANPRLWWPAGYGEQPLYLLRTELCREEEVLHVWEKRIGIRSIELDRGDEEDGSRYSFIVNGVPVFFKGENLIIQDAVLGHMSAAGYQRIIENCLRSNVNGIRIWGGAYFPPEEFYDMCDERGILIYQDMMFACSFYQLSEEYLENVRLEIKDNLSRIAHHACMALYCGNNEIDGIYTVTGATDPETVALRKLFGSGNDPMPKEVRAFLWSNYEPLFLNLIPKLCKEYAPDTAYVHSSPSSKEPGQVKSFFDYLSNGDMHYYLQYNGNAPYQKIRSFRCRFMTEIGFQSYPSMKTIRAFTEEEDRLPYTPVMYAHQKCANGNEAIELYMERDYRVPENFGDYVYLSQLQAGEIMRYTAEHFRRDNGYCRGMILWQLNDCWPVVSWSGIDYFGRWKALQYYIRRFYAPVLISACETGDKAELWLSNESRADCTGVLSWRLYGKDGKVYLQNTGTVTVRKQQSFAVEKLDFSDILEKNGRNGMYLWYSFSSEAGVSAGTVLFVLPKEFAFQKPLITLSVEEQGGSYEITVATDCFAKGIELDTIKGDCIFSDNFFDLPAGETCRITVEKADCAGLADAGELKGLLRVNTLNEVMLRTDEWR